MKKGTMTLTALLACVTLAGSALAFGLGDAIGGAAKVWEKKDAVVKAGKAIRKGTQDLTPSEEHFIGRSVAATILARYKRLNDPKRTDYVNRVGLYLTRFSDRPETFGGYHFLLLDAPNEVNAFAAPGGFIFVTSGLLAKVKSEEELAAVLAHEIAHVTLRHGLEAIKSSNLTSAFTIIGTEAVKEYSGSQLASLTEAFSGSIDDIVNKMVMSGYSQSQEFDADAEAMAIAFRAGYDPAGLTGFLTSLRDAAKGAPDTGFFKTHPPAGERLTKATSVAKQKKLTGAAAPARDKRFGGYKL
ncbi:MAG: M48 family metalloprotease [Nitrospinae bacterium]|nr:M48 family metalloprotease [Nitrospinota bacterium]